MLAAAGLLADLFPAEWPPAGAVRRGSGCHLPPAHMRYRAGLARSFEPSAAALRHLLATAAASESILLRAALVRLCARASGLGGGMGMFVVGPLVEELNEAVQPGKPVEDSRRCLEVLVPLAYRPAIKVCTPSCTVLPPRVASLNGCRCRESSMPFDLRKWKAAAMLMAAVACRLRCWMSAAQQR
jgi:hypothetical protein